MSYRLAQSRNMDYNLFFKQYTWFHSTLFAITLLFKEVAFRAFFRASELRPEIQISIYQTLLDHG